MREPGSRWRRSKWRGSVIWLRVCAKRRNWPARKDGSAAVSVAAAPGSRTPNSIDARSATGSRPCSRRSRPWHVEHETQRARRQGSESPSTLALVGYTNAGKSTLMRALTGSDVLVANKLFATLDTTVRVLQPESVPRVLVTDTVGFIKNLPHGLVESFKSTLEEALDASLLLHVIDASDPGFERQLEVTEDVLRDIHADHVPRIKIFNKIDHVGDADAQRDHAEALRGRYPDALVMSALRPDDVARLHGLIVSHFQRDLVEEELFVPWTAQRLRGEIFAQCEVLSERADADGAFFRVRGAARAIERLREQLDSATLASDNRA